MDIFTFLFLTVLIGCSIPLMKLWQDGRKVRAPGSGDGGAMQRQIDVLQQRVEVLEKIVTDEKYQLQKEFALLGNTP